MKEIINQLTGEVYEIPEQSNELIEKHNQLIAEQFTTDVLDMYAQYYMLKEQIEMFEYKVLKVCKENEIDKVDNAYFRINHTKAHTQKRVDTEKLKAAGLFEEFSKEVPVKESVRITIK